MKLWRLTALCLGLAACTRDPATPVVEDAAPIAPPPGAFQPLGPSAAFVWHVVPDPANPQRIFLALDDGGGVWRSDDRGATYVLVSEELPDVLAWGFALDATDSRRVYAGDAHGRGVFLSRDGGDTWAFHNAGLETYEQREVVALAVDPIDPATIWAGTVGGAHVSRDAGDTWQPVAGPLGTTPIVGLTATTRDGVTELVVATGQQDETDPDAPDRVYRSRDAGATFTDVTPLLIAGGAPATGPDLATRVSDLRFDARGRLLIAMGYSETSPGAVLRSTPDGAEFTKLAVTGDSLFVKVAVPAGAPDTIYVTGGLALDPMVFVSTDDGATFEGRGSSEGALALPISITVDPADPRHVWLGAFADLMESSDGGASWERAAPGIHHSCATGVAVDAAGGRLYAGSLDHFGLVSRRNAYRREADVWTELAVPSDVFTFAVPGADEVIAGTLYQGAYESRDGGRTFDAARGIPRDRFSVLSLHVTTQGSVLAGGASDAGAAVYRRPPGGTFAPVRFASSGLPNDFDERGGVIAAVGEGGVALSRDDGATWTLAWARDDDLRTVAILDDAAQVLLVGDAGGHVWRSDDGGRTFADAFTGFIGRTEVNRFIVDARDGSVLVGLASANVFVRALERDSGLWRSRDGGRTFSPVARARPSSHIYDLAWDPAVPGRLYAAMWCSGVQAIDLPLEPPP